MHIDLAIKKLTRQLLWLTPRNSSFVTASGGLASAVRDKTRSISATQPTGAIQPTYGSNKINNQDCLGFDGIAKTLLLPSDLYSFGLLQAGNTAIIVVKPASTVTNMRVLSAASGVTATYYIRYTATGIDFRHGNTAFSLAHTRDTNAHIIIARRLGSFQEIRIDGSTLSASATTATNGSGTDGFNIGSTPSLTEFYSGFIGDTIISSFYMADWKVNAICAYLANVYGITTWKPI